MESNRATTIAQIYQGHLTLAAVMRRRQQQQQLLQPAVNSTTATATVASSFQLQMYLPQCDVRVSEIPMFASRVFCASK